ncbi:hypothetical protein PsorP6_011767 [Peronosclerospora sorghi]|uniref:Uncharacterized protein n=1 Tax=Peronosclerospora sorghi TaxID=230839 RepID=A0ACC0WKH7_9STRA|nr:hypothetical protein PsorP6_011767 [Peronosclerospora sorghi]
MQMALMEWWTDYRCGVCEKLNDMLVLDVSFYRSALGYARTLAATLPPNAGLEYARQELRMNVCNVECTGALERRQSVDILRVTQASRDIVSRFAVTIVDKAETSAVLNISCRVGSDDEKLVGMLEDALLGLIWIVTELAPPLDAIEQQETVLRREIIHRLSQNSCKLSDLLEQTTRRETLVLFRSGPDAFEEANATCRGIKRVKRQPTVLEDSDMSLTSDQDQSNGDEVK